MAKAFSKKKTGAADIIRVLIPVLFFALITISVVMGLKDVSATSGSESIRLMEQNLRRATVQCYAIEGRYPPSLEYLSANYGVILNPDKYIYHYRAMGMNLMPDIAVFSQAE